MADAPAAPAAPAPTDISDDNIEDVSLVNPAPQETPAQPAAEPAAEPGKDDAAATPAEGDKPADPKPAEGEETPPADPAKPDDKAQPAEAPKDLTPEERQRAAARAFQQRQQTRNQVAQRVDEHYAPKSEADLVNEGMKPEQAQIEALRQEMAYKEQRTQIAELNAGLQSDAVNVEHDMPVFNPKSDQYDEAFTRQVEQAYRVASRLQTDENGIVLSAEVPLYDFHKQMYDIYSRGTANGATDQQAANAAMEAATENPGGSSSTGKGGNESLEEMEARLGDVVIGS